MAARAAGLDFLKLLVFLGWLLFCLTPFSSTTLKAVVLAVFSYHDFRGEPGKVYHALVMGLLVWISGTHEIKSNRESGYGRYDIMIIPTKPVMSSNSKQWIPMRKKQRIWPLKQHSTRSKKKNTKPN